MAQFLTWQKKIILIKWKWMQWIRILENHKQNKINICFITIVFNRSRSLKYIFYNLKKNLFGGDFRHLSVLSTDLMWIRTDRKTNVCHAITSRTSYSAFLCVAVTLRFGVIMLLQNIYIWGSVPVLRSFGTVPLFRLWY